MKTNYLKILFSMLVSNIAVDVLAVDVNGIGIDSYRLVNEGKAYVGEKEYGKYEGDIVIPEEVRIQRAKETRPYRVIGIARAAFRDCNELTSVEIPTTVTTIMDQAFWGCSKLKTMTIPYGVTEIAEYLFRDCSSLTSVTIPRSVMSINSQAFQDCNSLVDIYCWANDVPSIDNTAFKNVNLANITIHVPASSIDAYKKTAPWGNFKKIVPLESINPQTDQANNFNLGADKGVSDPEGFFTHSTDGKWNFNWKFKGATYNGLSFSYGLKMETTTEINFTTTQKSTVTIVQSTWSDHTIMFDGEEIPITDAVDGTECRIYTLENVVEGTHSIRRGSGESGLFYVKVSFGESNNEVEDLTDIYYQYSEQGAYVYLNREKNVENIIIPKSVIYNGKSYKVLGISEKAFAGSTALTSIAIPNSVTSIGDNAFYRCTGLTSITIPKSVTSIGVNAFQECSSLSSITISESVTSIADSTFFKCLSLTSINIPNSVTSIGKSAFEYCSSLTSITIPNSVTSIGYSAFSDCSKLTSVTVLNPTPVAITQYVFSNRKKATLYVPQGSKGAYQKADYWKEFKNIVEIGATGIDQILVNKNGATSFTLEGKRINKAKKGLNIIDGRKVVIK